MRRTDSAREKVADRLLKSSATRFYDPEVDIDWAAPIPEDKPFALEKRCSLYGTELWDRLTPEQRLELGKHEVASIASNGIFFELLLMRMLLKEIYHADPTTRHVQYALTEIADECRHSVMFARYVERTGAPAYGPVRIVRRLGRLLPVIGYGPALYGSILVAEEILDRLQRESMADENVQPLVRMVNRIHVLEEARHVAFAREEVTRRVPELSRTELWYQRWLLAVVSFWITRTLINPRVYRAVGLDPVQARRVALANPHYQESLRWAGARIMAFLSEAGLVGAPGTHWWRRSFLLADR
ncbi:AurF N-oxygenase family protein [Amycolatopsis taiwanensis]|uniref:Membrane protein n=1 Tax=Amycolatopsis taiwanensis TaxID=342230 RepID=A0A9W6R2F0_9PSEU|nr:diiron oxygenase [Amycolatopsis taiwanensis]GLY68276.1 membrane protein [Amycolatopsis taiwanensis]